MILLEGVYLNLQLLSPCRLSGCRSVKYISPFSIKRCKIFQTNHFLPISHAHAHMCTHEQETESSLRRMQLRMQEAEKRMIQDDILTDDVLMEPSGEFPRPSGMVLFPPPSYLSFRKMAHTS